MGSKSKKRKKAQNKAKSNHGQSKPKSSSSLSKNPSQKPKTSYRKMKRQPKVKTLSIQYEKDIGRIMKQLLPLKLSVYPIDPDGSCLFRAFSHQLYGHQNEATTLRDSMCEYLLAHSNEYAPYVDNLDVEKYALEMIQPFEWGGQLEIQILCNIHKVNCTIHNLDGDPIQMDLFPDVPERRIHLSFHMNEHYNSVVPIDTLTSHIAKEYLKTHQKLSDSQRTLSESIQALSVSTGITQKKKLTDALRSNQGNLQDALTSLGGSLEASCSGSTAPLTDINPSNLSLEEKRTLNIKKNKQAKKARKKLQTRNKKTSRYNSKTIENQGKS